MIKHWECLDVSVPNRQAESHKGVVLSYKSAPLMRNLSVAMTKKMKTSGFVIVMTSLWYIVLNVFIYMAEVDK